jgi:hypothetical protein
MRSPLFRFWGSHSSGYEEFYPPQYKDVWSIQSQQTFRRNILPPFPGSKNKPSKKPDSKQSLCSYIAVKFVFLFTLKIEAIHSSETLVYIQRTTRRYIAEDRTPYIQCYLESRSPAFPKLEKVSSLISSFIVRMPKCKRSVAVNRPNTVCLFSSLALCFSFRCLWLSLPIQWPLTFIKGVYF